MSQWQPLPDRWQYRKYPSDRPKPARKEDKSLAELRAENQRLTQLVKQLTQALKALQPALPALQDEGIPEVVELELMRGRKLARLVRQDDAVQFAGIGMNGIYDVEGYAECLMRKNHEVPHPDCSCGFYIPAKLGNAYGDPRQHWMLDVEFGGKVLDCGMGALPVPARGYKASWQRVLSVTAPTMCVYCGADAEHVCMQFDARIEALCPKCASGRALTTREKPLTWVREHLATELIAPNLTDAVAEPALAPWEEELLRSREVPTYIPLGTAPTTYPYTTTGTSTSFPPTIWAQNGLPIWIQNGGSITWKPST